VDRIRKYPESQISPQKPDGSRTDVLGGWHKNSWIEASDALPPVFDQYPVRQISFKQHARYTQNSSGKGDTFSPHSGSSGPPVESSHSLFCHMAKSIVMAMGSMWLQKSNRRWTAAFQDLLLSVQQHTHAPKLTQEPNRREKRFNNIEPQVRLFGTSRQEGVHRSRST